MNVRSWSPPPLSSRSSVLIGARAALVLDGVCRGLTNDQIGRQMHVTENSVKTHLQRLYRQLGALNRAHLVALAVSGQVPLLVRVDGWST